jgi:SNF2 family DNA or RNA helicase
MSFKGTLFPYQPEAVDRMVVRKKMLVAYEMGLGKTCMTIAAIENLKDEGTLTKPVLVIALSSLKYQWEKEIQKFSNSSTVVVDGSKSTRTLMWDKGGDYVICNYESVVNDWDLIKDTDWGAIICDEATAIKSFKSKRSKAVKKLSADVPIRFALTGTPIENGRPEELYSIMQFVDPKVLGRFDLFDQTFIVRNHFGGVQRYRNLPIFHERMKDSSVRKTQKDPDVAPYLPETIHYDPILVQMDKKSSALYKRVSTDLLNELLEAQQLLGSSFSLEAHYGQGYQQGGPADALRGSIMSKITALRMLCDHPQLLQNSSDKFALEEGQGSVYAAQLVSEGLLDGLTKSTKLDMVIEYVTDHLEIDENAKVVIFTCYLGMLPLIQEALAQKKFESRVYSGQMNANQKEIAKTEFQTSKEVRVLISSDAGGYGVDLPQANLLVNYDLPWSSGTAVQRNSRIRRASSTWSHVMIQDFLVLGSIEERQHQMLNQKNAVADAVIDGEGINTRGGVDLTVGSLLGFIQENKA